MDAALALGCVLPAAVGAGRCVVGSPVAGRLPADPPAAVAMAVMVLGMADTMLLGSALLPAPAWAAAFAALAGWLAGTRRATAQRRRRSLHLGVMGLVTAVLAYPPCQGLATDKPGEHRLLSVALLLPLGLAASAGYTSYAVWLAAREGGWDRVELAAAALSTLAMGAMVAVM